MDEPRLSQFLSLAAPLMVSLEGERVVVLAFGLTLDGDLVAMTLATGGGTLRWVPAIYLDFPAPVTAHPGAPGQRIERTLQ